MDDREALANQYRTLSYDELKDVQQNAVLSKEAAAVLQVVLKEKEKSHFTGETLSRVEGAKAAGDLAALSSSEVEYLAKQIILTTETNPIDLRIAKRIEIISAECVYGMNILKDAFLTMRDLVGGRSATAQKTLRKARQICLVELKREALMVGADAVIGVTLDYSEISGGGKSQMLMIVATGTAVTLKTRRTP